MLTNLERNQNASEVNQAISAFVNLLGAENCLQSAPHLAKAETATFITTQKLRAIAYPKNLKALHGCVLLANKHQIPLYPISKGKNWGYGSKVPYRDESILVVLEKMNRILAYNEQMGYVTLEPGVSFAQLRKFLKAQNSTWLIDAPGSTLEASVIGNTLERGFAQSQHGERHQHIANMEVLLPNGELVHTAMGAFENANTSALHVHGIGPALNSLFFQSNLGIVTKMTLQLARRPKYRMQLFFHFREIQLQNVTDCLRELHQKEFLTVTASLYNQERLLANSNQLPNLPFPKRKQIDGKWYGTSAIHGENIQILRGKQYAIEEAFAKLDIALHFGELNHPNPHYGWSSPDNLKLAYAKKQTPEHIPDPDIDGCGLIWCAPIVPLEGEAMTKCIPIVKQLLNEFNFTPFLSIHKISSRIAYLIAPIIYDRSTKGEDERAIDCHQELIKHLTGSGYYPYRMSQASTPAMPSPEASHKKLLQNLKKQFDPNNILAPGRYDWFYKF